jgi:NAD(P)-dependent dehydrogenase (short-subunit alcohol dehydrogenase family)
LNPDGRRLAGVVALITGGGTGIGAATARRFSDEGAAVVLLGPDAEPLTAVAGEVDGLGICGDAANPDDAQAAVDAALGRFGELNVIVTCAGGGKMESLVEDEAGAWHESLRMNLETCAVSCRAGLPAMLERGGGSIVIVSSIVGLAAGTGIAGYATAKAGLLGLTRSIAIDYGPMGVRANALCPGWVETQRIRSTFEAFAASAGISVDEAYRRANAFVPLRRFARPDEIAAIIAFLASADASIITGSVIVADGGQSAVSPALAFMTAEGDSL